MCTCYRRVVEVTNLVSSVFNKLQPMILFQMSTHDYCVVEMTDPAFKFLPNLYTCKLYSKIGFCLALIILQWSFIQNLLILPLF